MGIDGSTEMKAARDQAARIATELEWEQSTLELASVYNQEQRDDWVDEATCKSCMMPSCNQGFGLFSSKHHCRRCGRMVCKACVKYDNSVDTPVAVKGTCACTGEKE